MLSFFKRIRSWFEGKPDPRVALLREASLNMDRSFAELQRLNGVIDELRRPLVDRDVKDTIEKIVTMANEIARRVPPEERASYIIIDPNLTAEELEARVSKILGVFRAVDKQEQP